MGVESSENKTDANGVRPEDYQAPETGSSTPQLKKVEVGIAERTRAVNYFREQANMYLNDYASSGYDKDEAEANRCSEMAETVSNLLSPEKAVDPIGAARAIAEVGKHMGAWQDELRHLEGQYGKTVDQKRYQAEIRLLGTRDILDTLTKALYPGLKPDGNSLKGQIYGVARRLNNLAVPGVLLNETLSDPAIETLSKKDPAKTVSELDHEIGSAFNLLADNTALTGRQVYEGIQDVYRLRQIRNKLFALELWQTGL